MMTSPLDLPVPVPVGLGVGSPPDSADGPGLVLDLLVPNGLPVYFGVGALLVTGSANPFDGDGTTTTGGGSGMLTAEADGNVGASGGSMFD